MALRIIEAPGVEIKEIDKSQYTPSMTGTRCYVMGYSDKGECYQPMQFTSKVAWQNYYGYPDNEAERYFYNACSEVMNQNGVLYCARLPYENKAKDKMVGYKFKVSNTKKYIMTQEEYIAAHQSTIFHDKDYEKDALDYSFDNLLNREIDGNLSSLELDTELKTFYHAAIDNFDKYYNEDKNKLRYSVEYYEVLSSQHLSARFNTKTEAEEYLKEFENGGKPGVFKYYAGKECLVYDYGDWIAIPLCCEFRKDSYKKLPSESSYAFNEKNTLKSLYKDTENLLCGDNGLKTKQKYACLSNYNLPEQGTFVYLSDAEKSISTIYNSFDATVSQKDKRRTLDISSKIEDVKYVKNNSLAIISGEMTEPDATGHKIGLDGQTITISAFEVYKDFNGLDRETLSTLSDLTITVPRYVETVVCCDGYNTEPLYIETVQSLYNKMGLSNDATCRKMFENDEIWKGYLGKSLGQIVIDKNSSFEDLKRKFNTDTMLSSWGAIMSAYCNNTHITYTDIINKYGPTKQAVHTEVPYYPIVDADQKCTTYLEINGSDRPIQMDLTAVDEYRTDESRVPANTFWVVDKTCATLNSIAEDNRKDKYRQLIGIFPVITTAANALYAQSQIIIDNDFVTDYETVNNAETKALDESAAEPKGNQFLSTDISQQFSNKVRDLKDAVLDTISRDANGYFLPIQMNPTNDGFDSENLKKIGVVVYKAYLDASEGNKISFTPVESFCGSLDRDAKNPNTGVSTFLDKIVNTQSEYIYFFSNCFVNSTQKKILEETDLFIKKLGITGMLGWYTDETEEKISLATQYQSIDKCFKNVEDINERDIDIVVDAGLANIAQYMKSVYGEEGAHAYDLAVTDEAGNSLLKKWTCKKADDTNAWKTTIFKYDNFCKNVRKDCMFIADGPRPLVLVGEKKIIRSSKPSNTIDANILPYVKYATGLNTNYGAGYIDWFQITDEFTGNEFWCPPSIKAMGVYINTDLNFNYWDAPAGLNRGVIQALDVAFSPTNKQAGPIYQKNWNYAINYPNDGIVLEGQKTFQVKPSAFDRVNVRRLFLRLERQAYKVARYFVYEGNTAYTRQRLVDMLDPLFQQAKVGGGIYDYRIIADESINTPNVIDNNELRVKIGIKPVKTAEFILIDFIALATGGSFSEM